MSKKEKQRKLAKRLRALRRKKRADDINRFQTQEAFRWLFDESIFAAVVLHGNTTWNCSSLVALCFLWAISDAPQLTEAFNEARAKLSKLEILCSIETYQGLLNALASVTPKISPILKRRIHSRMKQIAGNWFRVGKWLPLAMDGSKETTTRSLSNELEFCAPNYGQGKNAKHRTRKSTGKKSKKSKKPKRSKHRKQPKPVVAPPPQVWVTMICHVLLGIPWCWKLGPSNSSERHHVREMLKTEHFLVNTLLLGDAGFVGYEFWKAIIEAGHHFVVRVGANMNLIEGLKPGQRRDTVHCWPEWAEKAGLPALELRLVKCKLGKSTVWLLTSVLDEKELTMKQMLYLYKKRWGIEVLFRDFKQTFNRGKLRCRTSQRVLLEIEWSIITMAAVKLCALREQLKDAKAVPEALSFSKSVNAFRHCFDNINDLPDFMDELEVELKAAVVDSYKRKGLKAGRYKPKCKRPPSCGQPTITKATRMQRTDYIHCQLKTAA